MRKEAAAHTSFLSAVPNPALIEVMALEIRPEPSETERKAIVRALELEAEQSAAPSSWQEAGLGPERPDDEVQAGAPPRQSRGAARA
jgi:hypothetical protein